MENQPTIKNALSEWLEKLQQESWQLELLISGFLILSLFQAKVGLFNLLYDVQEAEGLYAFPLLLLMYALVLSWYIFTFNLIFHVLIRGLWIGAIGLRYVSGDIDYDKLDYSKRFNDFYRKRVKSFDDYIEKLESLDSVLFAYTFLLFFMIFSFAVLIALLVVFIMIYASLFSDGGLSNNGISINGGLAAVFLVPIMLFLLFGGILMLIDFIFLGALKKIRNKIFSKAFFFVFRVFSFLSLSFIWRPLLLNFLDTKYTRRLFLLALPYGVIVALVIPNLGINQVEYYPTFGKTAYEYTSSLDQKSFHFKYYEEDLVHFEKSGPNKSDYVLIPKKIISDNYLKIFIPSRSYADFKNIEHTESDIFPISRKGVIGPFFGEAYLDSEEFISNNNEENESNNVRAIENNLSNILQALSDEIEIRIDTTIIQTKASDFDFHLHPIIKEVGLLNYIDISDFERGKHILHVDLFIWKDRKVENEDGGEAKNVSKRVKSLSISIPFIKD